MQIGSIFISRACEALGWGGSESRRFVSKRIAFFGNALCLPNFRQSANSLKVGTLQGPQDKNSEKFRTHKS